MIISSSSSKLSELLCNTLPELDEEEMEDLTKFLMLKTLDPSRFILSSFAGGVVDGAWGVRSNCTRLVLYTRNNDSSGSCSSCSSPDERDVWSMLDMLSSDDSMVACSFSDALFERWCFDRDGGRKENRFGIGSRDIL